MHSFDPALDAEIAYRREDVRSSFRSTRRFRIRPTRRTGAPADATTGSRPHRPGPPASASLAARTA